MDAIARAQQRIEDAAAGRTDPAAFDATLERARHAVESLAATTARFESGLPEAIQDGLRQHFRPSARHLAEMRGLTNQVIRRLVQTGQDRFAEIGRDPPDPLRQITQENGRIRIGLVQLIPHMGFTRGAQKIGHQGRFPRPGIGGDQRDPAG